MASELGDASGRTWKLAISALAALLPFLSGSFAGAAAPVVTSASTASGTAGAAFSYQITAANSPTSFDAAGLPAGLSVDTTLGLISGTPSAAGTANVTLSAANADGTGTAALVLTINPPAPVITSALSASATAGAAFSYQITAANSPTSFNAGGLPAGLTVDTSLGLISGTPSAAGSANVALSAANAGGTGAATLALTVNPPAPAVTSALNASATAGAAFSYQITATNSPTSFSALNLPAGLGVNTSNGVISGTPSAAGTNNVTLGAANAGGTGTAALVLTVNPPAPAVTSALNAFGTAGAAFSYQITATNSPTSFNAGNLPAGLGVNTSNGVISGTPNAAGTTNVVVSAANAGGTGTATLVLTVNPVAPVITSALSASGTAGAAFSYQITAANSPTSFNASNLPAGLSVNTSNGVISGTPSAAGTNNAVLSAANAGGTGTALLALTINPPTPVITSGLSASGTVGAAFSYQIAAANFPTSFGAVNLPAGLSVNTSNGVISGTPSAAGTNNVAVSAANAGGTGTATLALTVNPPTPVITSALAVSSDAGAAFSYQITAANSPTSFSAAGLPAGLSVNTSNGVISGTPSSTGTVNVAIGAANAGGAGTATLVLTVNPPAPVITSALAVSTAAGAAFSYQITAANFPTSFNAANLPAGLSVNTSNGVISGTPSSTGTARVALDAANAGGTGTALLTLTINPPAPVITSALAVSSDAGAAFSYQITATNSPTSFNAGNLPAGLSVNTSNGVISGKPGAAGTKNVVVSAANAGGTGTATLVLTVNPPAPAVSSALSASGLAGAAFRYQITATNSPTSFNAANLPAGLGVDASNGVISGTPSAAGTAIVVLSAANAGGTGTAALALTINPAKPVITSALSASGTAGAAFSYQITAANSPTSFNASGLPAGLGVDTSDGVVSGTPSSAGTYRVVVSAANAAGTATAAVSFTVSAGLSSGVTAAADLSAVRVYPVPYRPGSGNTDSGGGGTGIVFDRLTASATIKIYTVTGRLVTSIEESSASGQVNWDARSGGGRNAASGLYLAVISAPGSPTVTRKILIIR